jgi:CubicO group peptidase (beta-lactamase class C family)
MKKSLKIFLWFLFAIVLYGVLYFSPYKYLIKGIKLTYLQGTNSAHFTDWYGFDTRVIPNGSKVSTLPKSFDSRIPLSDTLRNMLEETESGSYLVFRNDTLVYEEYFNGFTDTHHLNSFSMAKTFTTLLVQKAIEIGYIPSWDVPVKKYLPWLSGPFSDSVTLRHLSTMTAGLDWNENYVSPFSITARAYYTDDIEGVMRGLGIINKPGEKWQYQSGSTQLLTFVLREALRTPAAIRTPIERDTSFKTTVRINELKNEVRSSQNSNNQGTLKSYNSVSEFASEHFWGPLGMEAPALWSLDRKTGNELGFCCLNAVSRDFGRLGLWVLNHGKWGDATIDSAFLNLAAKPYKDNRYGHSFWISNETPVPFHYFQGLNGQYICIIPSYNMVVVRTGKHIKRMEGDNFIFTCVRTYVSEAVRLFGVN